MTQQSEHCKEPPVEEAAVAEYLAATPDFFERHEELLLQLKLPDTNGSGNSISLIERQLAGLRKECAGYQQQLDELVKIGRKNDQLIERLHQLTLALIDTTNLDEVLNALEDHLHEEFAADRVELWLFTPADLEDPSGLDTPEREAISNFQNFFKQDKPLCGRLTKAQLDFLFGIEADDIRSAALIPMRNDAIAGMLAVGSSDEQRFQGDMGTEFLSRLGDIVSQRLEMVSEPGG
ncbi:hypothetical protein MNBD_GAMMA26-742 [hydrothermal vent metagenome]|uniref:DUF484 domain-containing protein n=1 Tax=hydrothermal vent metagenome TaxID=652676 RepID=A0A3B1B607_9ZZZZ